MLTKARSKVFSDTSTGKIARLQFSKNGALSPPTATTVRQKLTQKLDSALIPKEIFNVNILSERPLIAPERVHELVPLTAKAAKVVVESRRAIAAILERIDPRLLVVVGPCSIHDIPAAKDYAARLRILAEKVSESFVLVMRVYFEKPRTTVGWKGFINDPNLDDSFEIEEGLIKGRQLLIDINELGVPCATEALDPVMPQYLHDLICWTAIGARTTESQKHRELASGLSTPVGFKNGTDGSITTAINALKSVSSSHHFLGINTAGQTAVMQTRGNAHAHVVLRGGMEPNYDEASILSCEQELLKAGVACNLMVDCSHGNSSKDPSRQPAVMMDCVNQILRGNRSIIGFMLESNIAAGRQEIPNNLADLCYGVSITDGCIGWQETEALLLDAAHLVKPILQKCRR